MGKRLILKKRGFVKISTEVSGNGQPRLAKLEFTKSNWSSLRLALGKHRKYIMIHFFVD